MVKFMLKSTREIAEVCFYKEKEEEKKNKKKNKEAKEDKIKEQHKWVQRVKVWIMLLITVGISTGSQSCSTSHPHSLLINFHLV